MTTWQCHNSIWRAVDALQAFVQADSLGSTRIAALCEAHAAEVHGRRRDPDAARLALDQALTTGTSKLGQW